MLSTLLAVALSAGPVPDPAMRDLDLLPAYAGGSDQTQPTLLPDGQGGFMLVWVDSRLDLRLSPEDPLGNNDLFFFIAQPDGGRLQFPHAARGRQLNPHLLALPDGGALLSFEQEQVLSLFGQREVVVVALNRSTGAFVDPALFRQPGSASSLVFEPLQGRALVVWSPADGGVLVSDLNAGSGTPPVLRWPLTSQLVVSTTASATPLATFLAAEDSSSGIFVRELGGFDWRPQITLPFNPGHPLLTTTGQGNSGLLSVQGITGRAYEFGATGLDAGAAVTTSYQARSSGWAPTPTGAPMLLTTLLNMATGREDVKATPYPSGADQLLGPSPITPVADLVGYSDGTSTTAVWSAGRLISHSLFISRSNPGNVPTPQPSRVLPDGARHQGRLSLSGDKGIAAWLSGDTFKATDVFLTNGQLDFAPASDAGYSPGLHVVDLDVAQGNGDAFAVLAIDDGTLTASVASLQTTTLRPPYTAPTATWTTTTLMRRPLVVRTGFDPVTGTFVAAALLNGGSIKLLRGGILTDVLGMYGAASAIDLDCDVSGCSLAAAFASKVVVSELNLMRDTTVPNLTGPVAVVRRSGTTVLAVGGQPGISMASITNGVPTAPTLVDGVMKPSELRFAGDSSPHLVLAVTELTNFPPKTYLLELAPDGATQGFFLGASWSPDVIALGEQGVLTTTQTEQNQTYVLWQRFTWPDAGVDAGTDAGMDAGSDAGTDAGSDAGTDAGLDAGTDAGLDGGTGSPNLQASGCACASLDSLGWLLVLGWLGRRAKRR